MEVKNVRAGVRGKMVALAWEYGGACHMVKSEANTRDVADVLWVLNDLLKYMEVDPDGSKMLDAGKLRM